MNLVFFDKQCMLSVSLNYLYDCLYLYTDETCEDTIRELRFVEVACFLGHMPSVYTFPGTGN